MHDRTLISLRGVGVSYDGHVALEGVDLDIYDDDFIGVIGPNGGGKSSLAKAILGAVEHGGTITIDNSLRCGSHYKIGYMPQVSQSDVSRSRSRRLPGRVCRAIKASSAYIGPRIGAVPEVCSTRSA